MVETTHRNTMTIENKFGGDLIPCGAVAKPISQFQRQGNTFHSYVSENTVMCMSGYRSGFTKEIGLIDHFNT
jgi:hypothetical protein